MQTGGKNERPVAKETMPAPSKPNRPVKSAPQAQRAATSSSKYDNLVDQDFDTSPGEKVLNVLFQWNGHSWDAYEVLGIPAGSSREAAMSAYQKHAAQADAQSQPFYKAAYEAITKATGTRG